MSLQSRIKDFYMSKTDGVVIESHAKSETAKDIFILKQLVIKDFKLKYRRSFLGVAWSVLNPLLMMVVMAALSLQRCILYILLSVTLPLR